MHPAAKSDATPQEQQNGLANGASLRHPTNQKAPQQPAPLADEPKPQKPQQAQQDKSFKFEFKVEPAQQAQQAAAPEVNGVQAKPEVQAADENGDGWSEDQQQRLVQALKQIGKDVKDRCDTLSVAFLSASRPLQAPVQSWHRLSSARSRACVPGGRTFLSKSCSVL